MVLKFGMTLLNRYATALFRSHGISRCGNGAESADRTCSCGSDVSLVHVARIHVIVQSTPASGMTRAGIFHADLCLA